ncbi:GNAT family N-acetyltransferase [bacterium]|nr:GNAT family N-acetyltransferase [bacterium]
MTQVLIESSRFQIALISKEDAHLVLDYYVKNRDHLQVSMPKFSEDFFTFSYWEKQLQQNKDEFSEGISLRLFVQDKRSDQIIASINFTEIQRGPFQGCFLGYGMDRDHQGQGLMTKLLKLSIQYAFSELNLHKILANYMPHNKASGRVLEKLGFHEVGLAKAELYLAGKWQDHIETRLINENWVNTLD